MLVRHKVEGTVYAMKMLRKDNVVKRNQAPRTSDWQRGTRGNDTRRIGARVKNKKLYVHRTMRILPRIQFAKKTY